MKKSPWWQDPTKITGLIISAIVIAVYVGSVFVAYAKQDAKLKEHDEEITKLDEGLTEQEQEAKDYYVQQQLIGRDMEYVKDSVKQILEEVKRKR